MHHFGCGMNWIKGYYMIVKVKNETFWFLTYSMEMHSLTSSSFIICLWGETFGSRTILYIHCSWSFKFTALLFFKISGLTPTLRLPHIMLDTPVPFLTLPRWGGGTLMTRGFIRSVQKFTQKGSLFNKVSSSSKIFGKRVWLFHFWNVTYLV